MRSKIVGLLRKIIDFFFRKRALIHVNPAEAKKRFATVLIPNQSHFPSLGIHRIRDTP
ncbi:hypothetical protein M1328_01685 [Patescibacteria group bacterium]|nr:hypothetical protein [Patescibacteria group bacterium]